MVGSLDERTIAHEPPRSIIRGGSTRYAVVAIAVVAIATRLATTIHYVEDLDSLHFALAMRELDIARLQPHFPGYLVFVGLARALEAITGSFATAFALVGGIATSLLVLGMLALARRRATSLEGAILAVALLGNGMVWVYGNRYMPDLLGVALLVWSMRDLLSERRAERTRGALLAALLAGTRLSAMPFIVPVALYSVARHGEWGRGAVAFAVGIALWAVPLVALTGPGDVVDIALNQTTGHFDEFGGTVRTEPDLARRAARMLEGLWTDGLAGYWSGRGALTAAAGISGLIALVAAAPGLARRLRRDRRWQVVAAGAVLYTVWIFLYQNVIHHSRHLLPLVPFLLLAVAFGLAHIARSLQWGRVVAAALLFAPTIVGVRLGWQHRQPSAIAQASRHLSSMPEPLVVVSTALVNYYLLSTGVEARFVAVDRPGLGDSLASVRPDERLVSVGDYRSRVARPAKTSARFYHNPYVNRIWPRIDVFEYTPGNIAQ